MSNVVSFVAGAKAHIREEIMDAVRDSLYACYDLREAAQETGVTVGALYCIRSGKTKWPRHTTLFRLLAHLGLELYVRKARRY